MRTVVTGATGMIGRALAARLPSPPAVLTRSSERARAALGRIDAFEWTPVETPAPAEALRGADVVFNLAGEPVSDARWTDEKKQRIHASRVIGTRNLVAGLAALDAAERPRVLVSASAVGFYGDRGDWWLDERAEAGQGFLADVCVDWEREAMAAERLGVRVVCVRIGIVLSPEGGALAKMLPAFRLGVGGRLGSGRQWMPWIHIDDIVGLLLHACATPSLRGPVNGVAPAPVTNGTFTQALARAVNRHALLPVPAMALQFVFGEMGDMLMASQRAVPRTALHSGYAFAHPDIDRALASLLTPVREPMAA